MFLLLNGPLGIGKSTLCEVLGERLPLSVAIDGDSLLALNPPPEDEAAALHEAIEVLVRLQAGRGYRHFIVNHAWRSHDEIEDLLGRLRGLSGYSGERVFLLSLPREANLARIARRQAARAFDEVDFEAETFAEEYAFFSEANDPRLGEPFDASDPPEALAARMLALLELN